MYKRQGAPFVIEGDEYDTAFFDKRAKFLHYLPEIAVVTSLEFDHGDIYADLAEIETAFQRMLRQIPKEGWLIACARNASPSMASAALSAAGRLVVVIAGPPSWNPCFAPSTSPGRSWWVGTARPVRWSRVRTGRAWCGSCGP